MKIIPFDIQQIIENSDFNSKILYQNNNFVLVIDPKHTQKNFHYTAWHKKDIRSLLELKKENTLEIKELIDNIKSLQLVPKDCKIYIHFPPNFWRLHIHFVSQEYFDLQKNNDSETYLIEDIINNLEADENYYRKNVKIQSKL